MNDLQLAVFRARHQDCIKRNGWHRFQWDNETCVYCGMTTMTLYDLFAIRDEESTQKPPRWLDRSL